MEVNYLKLNQLYSDYYYVGISGRYNFFKANIKLTISFPDAAGKPGTPVVADFDKNFVELKWTRPETDGGSPITGYVIEKKDKFSPDWEECAEVSVISLITRSP